MAGGGNDTKGVKGVQVNWASGGDMEGCGGNLTLPDHNLHRLPRFPTQISVGSRHRYRHPRGQSVTTACGHEVGGPVCDIPGPAQGVRRLGQVQVPRDLGRVQGWTQS